MLVQFVHKMTEFGTVIQVGRSTFLGISHVPHPKEARPQRLPTILGVDLLMHACPQYEREANFVR